MKSPLPSLVFDFDSTLVTVEGADELFARTVQDAPDREARVAEFQRITDRGMDGEISYRESLEARVALLDASRAQVEAVAREMPHRISPSVLRVRSRLAANAHRIWVISGGFEELILPVARELGLAPERVRAHRFRWTAEGRLAGLDPDTAMARGGKPEALRELAPPDPVWVVGDGATDLELRELGLAERFYAFVENRARAPVVRRADGALPSLEDLPTLR